MAKTFQDAPERQQSTPREKAMARMSEGVLEAVKALTLRYDLTVLDAMAAASTALFVAFDAAIDTYVKHRPEAAGAARDRLAEYVRALLEEMEARDLGKEW